MKDYTDKTNRRDLIIRWLDAEKSYGAYDKKLKKVVKVGKREVIQRFVDTGN